MSAEKRPLKVLHCIYTMFVGGAETMLVDIINGQIARGLDVSLLVVNKGAHPELMAKIDPRAHVIMMNRREGDKPLIMMARLNILILKLRPDIIHAHHHKFGRLVQVRRRGLLLTVHDIDTPMVYCAGTTMVAITDAVEADVRKRVPTARISTIYNGIRTADIPADTRVEAPSPLRLVQVARLNSEKKGQDVLIGALGELRRRGITDVEAHFIGREDDRPELEKLAAREGVAGQVNFEGLRDRDWIYAHLKDYDAMCHPSRWEGFGLTIAEAMAAGLPLVVTEGDGPWEVADHGRLCLSFRRGDAVACADAIERLRADWAAARARAAEAREYVRRFDISATVDNYIAFYRRLLKSKA